MMATAKNKLSTDFQSAINCVPERSLLGAFGKQHHDYDHDVFDSAGSTLATPHFGPENGVHLTHACGDKVLAATVNFPFVATENGTLPGFLECVSDAPICRGDRQKGAGAYTRMGDEDVAEGVFGPKGVEDRAVAAVRSESSDDSRVGRDGAVGPGFIEGGDAVFTAGAGDAQAGSRPVPKLGLF